MYFIKLKVINQVVKNMFFELLYKILLYKKKALRYL